MQEKDLLHDNHQDNDGIQEYDNPLPDWFVTLFYGCIVFAALHLAYNCGYTWALTKAGGTTPNLSASGADYLAAVNREEKSESASHPKEVSGAELLEFLKSPTSISGGEAVFKANCLACHGAEGQGVVGPNLTDAYWLHGGSPDSIMASISHGYPDKGMPAWKPVLGDSKVKLAAAFVMSLKGRTVANPKAPQGEKEP